ncbi:MAG: LPS export ABC transporter periplasmic protein LptC [Thermodesulfobacteriota bacterium]
MRRLLWSLAIVAVLAAASYAAWHFSGLGKAAREVAKAAKDTQVDVSVQGLTLSQGREGKLSWTLSAQRAEYLQEQGRIRVYNPRLVYYAEDRNGRRHEVAVSAPQGEVDQEREVADLGPAVRIESGNSTIHADALHYAGAGRTLRLAGNVTLVHRELSMNAAEVVLDLKTNEITARGGVVGELYADGRKRAQE